MNWIFSTAASAAVSAVVLLGVLRWAHDRSAHLRVAADFMDRFYAVAQKLIKDDTVPNSVTDFVAFMAERAGKPRLARTFAWDLITGRMDRPVKASQRSRMFEIDLGKMTAEQREAFAEMLMFGLLSSGASGLLFSRFYLAVMERFLSETGTRNDGVSVKRAQTVALDLSPQACAA